MEVHWYLNLRTGIFTPPTGGEGEPPGYPRTPHTSKSNKNQKPEGKRKGKEKTYKVKPEPMRF